VNDAPVLKNIPDQKIKEKGTFKEIDLNKFVRDPDHKPEQLTWTATVAKAAAAPAPKKEEKKVKDKKKDKKKAKKEED